MEHDMLLKNKIKKSLHQLAASGRPLSEVRDMSHAGWFAEININLSQK